MHQSEAVAAKDRGNKISSLLPIWCIRCVHSCLWHQGAEKNYTVQSGHVMRMSHPSSQIWMSMKDVLLFLTAQVSWSQQQEDRVNGSKEKDLLQSIYSKMCSKSKLACGAITVVHGRLSSLSIAFLGWVWLLIACNAAQLPFRQHTQYSIYIYIYIYMTYASLLTVYHCPKHDSSRCIFCCFAACYFNVSPSPRCWWNLWNVLGNNKRSILHSIPKQLHETLEPSFHIIAFECYCKNGYSTFAYIVWVQVCVMLYINTTSTEVNTQGPKTSQSGAEA